MRTPAVLTGIHASVNLILLGGEFLQPLLQRQHRAAPGQLAQISRAAPGSGWLAFIFHLTGSFTPWVGAPPTRLAASSLTRLNMIRSPIPGLPRGPLTPTRIQTTWLVGF